MVYLLILKEYLHITGLCGVHTKESAVLLLGVEHGQRIAVHIHLPQLPVLHICKHLFACHLVEIVACLALDGDGVINTVGIIHHTVFHIHPHGIC